MAPLKPIHWEAVTSEMRALLGELSAQSWMAEFYLAGGTALALQLGHRRSIDLDFFSEHDPIDAESRKRILTALAPHAPTTIEEVDGNLLLRLGDALHVAFLSYGYPLLEPTGDADGIALGSLRDVGLMKLDAAVGRGSRKDFIDLYFVAQRLALEELLEQAADKFPQARDFPLMAIESLLQFGNADRDVHPEMLQPVSWAAVRRYFVAEARRLGDHWLGGASPA